MRGTLKLVIYEPAWELFLPRLRPLLGGEWEIAANAGDHRWLLEQVADADALIALRLPPEALGTARKLRMLQFPGAGVMHSRPEELPAGCALVNVYEHEIPIAEYVMMAILMHVTQVRRSAALFEEGIWEGAGRLGGATHEEAYGKTLGIIGYGHIGRAAAARAVAFGMRVLAVSKRLDTSVPLPRLLAESDFVLIACPLTEETRGMIGERELALMRPDGVLINVARAEIVDERALFEALRDRRIGGAALDAWYRYPSRPGERMHGSRHAFHDLENVLATPHMSAWTGALLDRRMAKVAENLTRLARGLPLERVVMVGTYPGPDLGK